MLSAETLVSTGLGLLSVMSALTADLPALVLHAQEEQTFLSGCPWGPAFLPAI